MRTQKGDLLTDLVLQVLSTYASIHDHGIKLTKPFGQSPARWQIMGALSMTGLTVSQIARRIGSSRQAVQRIVTELSSSNIVRYCPNPDHRNSPKVELTEAGLATYNQINEGQAEWANRIGAGLTEESMLSATNSLRTLEIVLVQDAD